MKTPTISAYQEEYQYWRRAGHSSVVAKNRALDYKHRYLDHELSVHSGRTLHSEEEGNLDDWEEVLSSDHHHQDDTEELIQFCEVVRILAAQLAPRQLEFLWHLLMLEELDHYLDDDLAELCYAAVPERPENMQEVATSMGLALNNINVSTAIPRLRKSLQESYSALLRDCYE